MDINIVGRFYQKSLQMKKDWGRNGFFVTKPLTDVFTAFVKW